MAQESRPSLATGTAQKVIAATKSSEPRNAGIVHDHACESFTDFDAGIDLDCQCATREVRWIAWEAIALHTEHVPADSPRRQVFMDRKNALLAYIEAAIAGAR